MFTDCQQGDGYGVKGRAETAFWSLLIATRNRAKTREITQLLLQEPGLEQLKIVDLNDFPGVPAVQEEGETFKSNARAKALTAARSTGLASLADDSGLEVDALGGLPGVRSASFAREGATDEENNLQLLEALRLVEPSCRQARFRCAVALASPDLQVWVTEGTVEGIILDTPRGHEGFGYDPLFFVPELGKTFAEITGQHKNKLSHRGKALRAMVPIIRSLISAPG